MSCTARVRPSPGHWSDQYPHDNMGSHYFVSRHPSLLDSAFQNLTAGTSYSTLFNALENGGPAGLIYGYLFVWCGVILQALVMAEMASMYVFSKALPAILYIPYGICVTKHAELGKASAVIRPASLSVRMMAMALPSGQAFAWSIGEPQRLIEIPAHPYRCSVIPEMLFASRKTMFP